MGYSLHIFTTMGYYGLWNVIYQHWPCVTKFKHAAMQTSNMNTYAFLVSFFWWPGTPKMFLLKISKNSQDERKPTKVNKPVAGDSDAIADQFETKWIDMIWMGCEPSNCNLSYYLSVIRTWKTSKTVHYWGTGQNAMVAGRNAFDSGRKAFVVVQSTVTKIVMPRRPINKR